MDGRQIKSRAVLMGLRLRDIAKEAGVNRFRLSLICNNAVDARPDELRAINAVLDKHERKDGEAR